MIKIFGCASTKKLSTQKTFLDCQKLMSQVVEHHILRVNVDMKMVFLLVLINDKQLFKGIFRSDVMFSLKDNIEHSNNNVLHSFNRKLMMTLLKNS